MYRLIATVTVVMLTAAWPVQTPVDTQALPRMVATERAFAAATAEIGVRDGFLTFFADDSVRIERTPKPAAQM